MTSTIGIPIKLLNEATGHQVTVEIDSGQTYRGKLIEAEDNMNCQLENINVTQRDGRVTHLDRVYIRGSHVRLFIVPDMLRNAPMFKSRGTRGRGVGLARGRATVNRARGQGRATILSAIFKMDIKHSKRILLLGKREAGALDVVKDLTGTAPEPDVDGSTAGLTHEWNAETAYYKAKVPIWIDEVPDFAAWKHDFLKPEAKEVVDAVGAWIYCFPRQPDGQIGSEMEEAMKSVQEVVEEHGIGSDVVLLAVARSTRQQGKEGSKNFENQDAQEDTCTEFGFEYINYSAEGKNEFGERVGFERLKEALEANEWADDGEEELDLDELGMDTEDGEDGFGDEKAEMTAELFGMKAALGGTEDDDAEELITPQQQACGVEDLDRMLGKLLAGKEQSADLSGEQRRRLAAKAVRELMMEKPNA
ncbi:hypothetical protein AC579_4031 [Pseudocercospora musae]|uniref:Sm domain-containing protein n=1 Tax=Pseudocercospora musae TaxID=113226 RepID=A0A139I2M3_9PEZI|nr:hypothetical protein AC579_4031 [Pseudocercospora musae]